MDYVLVVKQPVYGSQGAFLAYQLAQELVQKHHIRQIFFYQDGVSNGNAFVYPANDEFNLVKAWQAFSRQFNVHYIYVSLQHNAVVWWTASRRRIKVRLVWQTFFNLPV